MISHQSNSNATHDMYIGVKGKKVNLVMVQSDEHHFKYLYTSHLTLRDKENE